jgi:hydroxymethylpyrimidine pyrophosphatase-like HAD family hydrolase
MVNEGAPPRAVVFFDIDGTLLDRRYQPNSDRLPVLVQELEARGVTFGCNSNRSAHDLIPILKHFHLCGPAVAENGCFVFSLRERTPQPLARVPPLRPTLEPLLECIARKRGAVCAWRDTVAMHVEEYERTPLAYVANTYRQCTGSIHVLRDGQRSREEANVLAEELRKGFARSSVVVAISVSETFFNVLISPFGVDKASALRALRGRYPGVPFLGVGDSAADLTLADELDVFFAVANAEPAVKEKAVAVASTPYTQGVEELMERLDDWVPLSEAAERGLDP